MPTPPKLVEQLWGQTYNNGTAKQIWLFTGFEDVADVDGRIKEFNDDEVPLSWAGLPLDTNWDVNEVGGGVFLVTATFSSQSGPVLDPTADSTEDHPQHGGDEGADQPVAANVSFSCRTGTQRLYQSLETVSSAAVGDGPGPGGFALARNFGGAIGVTTDHKVEGFDVFAGEPTWTLVGKIPAFLVTGAYQRKFQSLFMPRPCMNDKKFFGYQKGEVLILDGSISDCSSNGFRDVTVTFGIKLNQDAVIVSRNPLLELYDVGGWNIIWCTYRAQKQTISGQTRLALLPFEAYQERGYEYGDFDDLKVVKFKTKLPPAP